MELIELQTVTIEVKRGEKKIIYKMKEITADDYWSIQDQCIDKKSETFELDTHKLNLYCIAKSIVDPSMTIEEVAKLPRSISERLLAEFRKLNNVEATFFLEPPATKELEKSM